HTNAAVRCSLADRAWSIGSVNAVALLAQPNPTRSDWIAWPWFNDFSFVVVSGVGNTDHDSEGARRTWGRILADGNGVDFLYCAVLYHRQFAVGNADNKNALRQCLRLHLRHGRKTHLKKNCHHKYC